MGIVLAWSSTYPGTVDTVATNFPTVSDGVHDVLSSHVNSLASAVVALQNVVGGLRVAPIQEPLSLSNGDVLVWNSTNVQFEGGSVSFTEAGNIGAKSVDLTGLQDGDIVVYNLGGDNFVRQAPASGSSFITGATYSLVTTPNVEQLIGGFVFDPSALTSPTLEFSFYGILQSAGGTADAVLRLYDLGVPGTPVAGVLRSTLTIANADKGSNAEETIALTTSGAPGTNTNEIFNSDRMYEVRLIITSGTTGDTALNLWSGLKIT